VESANASWSRLVRTTATPSARPDALQKAYMRAWTRSRLRVSMQRVFTTLANGPGAYACRRWCCGLVAGRSKDSEARLGKSGRSRSLPLTLDLHRTSSLLRSL
jgi:hypothetical protein